MEFVIDRQFVVIGDVNVYESAYKGKTNYYWGKLFVNNFNLGLYFVWNKLFYFENEKLILIINKISFFVCLLGMKQK